MCGNMTLQCYAGTARLFALGTLIWSIARMASRMNVQVAAVFECLAADGADVQRSFVKSDDLRSSWNLSNDVHLFVLV